ncbi:MAG: cyclic-di-AMP receptor [Tissierellaceae bacterium]
MKLVIAIIQDEYINKVIRALMEKKIRTTKLSSTGGFLKSGNTTLLIGTEEKDIPKIVEIIKAQCKSTKVKEGDNEVTVGGANLFILDIDEYVKI